MLALALSMTAIKGLAAVFALVAVEFLLMPTEKAFPLAGVTAVIGGVALLVGSQPFAGASLIVLGVAMTVFGVKLGARKQRDLERVDAQTADRIGRMMSGVHIPRDDES